MREIKDAAAAAKRRLGSLNEAPPAAQTPKARYASPAADAVLGVAFPIEGVPGGAVALMDYHGGDDAVVDGARTSFGASVDGYGAERNAKLVAHLVRNRHTSPLEQAGCTFQAAIPIYVCRQLVRHRTLKFNEFSMRYAAAEPRYHFPRQEDWCAGAGAGDRQGRGAGISPALYRKHMDILKKAYEAAGAAYARFLNDGVASELARLPVPVGQFTLVRFAVDIHNLQHLLGLRLDAHAQREFRAFAAVLAALARKVAPVAMDAWLREFPPGAEVPDLDIGDALPAERADELMSLRAET